MAGLPANFDLDDFVSRVLAEDLGAGGDVTSQATIDAGAHFSAAMNAREPIIVAGLQIASAFFRKLDDGVVIEMPVRDGDQVEAGAVLMRLEGRARAMLTAERSALNTLQHLSGIATLTRRYVDAIAGTGATLLDTRKTIPGLRMAQKYAVRVGGGANQRLALWHGILIKENHIAAAGGVGAALRRAQALESGVDIQIEVETVEQLREALDHGATSVLLDNFSLDDMRAAVALNRGHALLEVSGGVTLATLRDIAATGVDRISVGKLTKDVAAVDYSMRVLPG
jgi:nicotinate-nucleotide pyrophosphorylase (carboxylating)